MGENSGQHQQHNLIQWSTSSHKKWSHVSKW